MPMFDVHTLDEEMGAALVQQRLIALLSSLFGGLALLLACVGLYGLLAFAMVQRIGEMGVRMALGARRVDVVWLVVREAWLLVTVGYRCRRACRARGPCRIESDRGTAVRSGPTDPDDRGGGVGLGRGGPRGVSARAPGLARRSDGGASSGVTMG